MQNLIIGADYRTFKHILECCMTTKQAISALSRTCPAQEFKFLLLRHAEPGADTRSELFSYFRLRYPRKSRHLSPSLQSLKGLLFRLLFICCFLLPAYYFNLSFQLWEKRKYAGSEGASQIPTASDLRLQIPRIFKTQALLDKM